jgi:hypothetical protein
MMAEMDIETSVHYVHLTRLIAREDYIKFTRRESTKTYIGRGSVSKLAVGFVKHDHQTRTGSPLESDVIKELVLR